MPSSDIALKKTWLNVPCFFLFLTAFFSSGIPSHAKISYDEHCSNIVPQSIISGPSHEPIHVSISSGYISGGDQILGPDPDTSSSSSSSSSPNQSLPGQFKFYTGNVCQTKTPGIFHLTGSLEVEGERTPTSGISSFYRTKHWSHEHRFMTRFKFGSFDMSGFWSKTAGKLCMVGTGSTYKGKGTSSSWSGQGTNLKPTAVFTVNYPNNSNIYTCIVSGAVESVDASDSPNHFDTISVLGYAPLNYNYTLIPRVRHICSHAKVPIESLGFEISAFTKHFERLLPWKFRLEYSSDCSALNCNPFPHKKKSLEILPRFMTLNWIHSTEDGNAHMHIGFTNSSSYVHHNFFIPEMSLVGEGYWDSEKKLLGVLACPVMMTKDPLKDSFVGECTIGISFWFPAVFKIRNSSNVMGRIWSVKGKSHPRYFSPISFQSFGDKISILPGVKYEYTEVDSSRETCEQSTTFNNLGSERYPDENSIGELKFDLTVRSANGSTTSGYATPLSFGDNFFGNSLSVISSDVSFSKMNYNISQTLWNVSYMISYSFYSSSLNMDEVTDISAEGVYNSATGTFCMMGCRDLSSSEISDKRKAEGSADCEIQINIQLSPLNQYNGEHLHESVSSTRHLNGTIKSTRNNSDPLYFVPLEISSYAMYTEEARDTIRRMDMEAIMVVVSLTLSCIFIVLQIFYVRKHRDVLPSISITMLVVLTLCHMIPLLLSFESLFLMNGRKKNVMLWSGGWIEVKEFVMRVMTMLNFLFFSRLLQLAWTARCSKEDRKGLWASEMKALLFCLPLYFVGGLIAWFAHTRSHKTQGEMLDYFSERNQSVLKDMISYVGLVLDGFLLPQIVLNVTWNSKDKTLAPLFYMGTTAVRALPHLYDAYRARNYVPYFNFSYIYASPNGDYYSTAWDIIIPLVGVIFAVLIYFQQQFGGGCVLPKRFRKPGGYEAVPAIRLETF